MAPVCLAITLAFGDADPAVFHRYDKDGDGLVTPAELGNPGLFARFDLDGDGSITMEEYQRASATMPDAATNPRGAALEALIASLDRDGDGTITREEAAGAPWFERIDRNKDGVIAPAELELVRRIFSFRGGGTAGGDLPLPAMPRATSPEELRAITSGPEILKPGESGIGRMIPDVTFQDRNGQSHRLSQMNNHRGAVIAMTSATCPVSKRYLPALAALEGDLRTRGIVLLLVNPFASESDDLIESQLAEAGITAPYVHDREKALAAALRATTTTEVFLIDPTRTLVYRGALDDQYGINYSLDEPRHRYLADAVSALLAGRTPDIAATAAPGCELDLGEAPRPAATPVTYHRDVARILQTNCVTCHREGGIAPFALEDEREVLDRAKVIRRVVTEGTMPPWFAALPADGGPSPWANDCSLSARDKTDLLAWLDSSDRPPGDPAEAPVPRSYPDEWSIGTPDLVIPLSRPYSVKATGFMPYQFDVVQTPQSEDCWVSAYEIRPTARDVVHHVIVQVHEPGSEVRNVGEGAGGYWAAYVPGNGFHVYPDGFARKIPAGARVSFQIHYTPSGRATEDRLKLGLVFARQPPRYEVKTLTVADHQLDIPPGAADHVEGTTRRAPFDVPVTSLMAHMHTRGKSFRYEVTYPDGREEILLDIPHYDFNWQLRYDYKQPKLIPRGSVVKVTAVFDNSTANKANPDPTKRVRWGPQTTDEMLIGYLEYFVPLPASSVAALP